MDDILKIRVDGKDVAAIQADQVPCELTPDVPVTGASTAEFLDASGTSHLHHLPAGQGWLHLSVRVHASLACQADGVVTAAPTHEAGAPLGEQDIGVRFQPFFLADAQNVPDLTGRGMFARGLHYSGTVTPTNILLSCECDACHRTFIVRSFHAGFSNRAYFYSGLGRYTLSIDDAVEGAPAALNVPDPAALRRLEAALPPAPDGTRFAYLNPFRCPHCSAPYIDFAAYPDARPSEYYAIFFPDTPPIQPDETLLAESLRGDAPQRSTKEPAMNLPDRPSPPKASTRSAAPPAADPAARRIRIGGMIAAGAGIFILLLMGTITWRMAPMLLTAPERMPDGSHFAAAQSVARLVLALFGSVLLFGVIAVGVGTAQAMSGLRRRGPLFALWGTGALIVIMTLVVMSAIKQAQSL